MNFGHLKGFPEINVSLCQKNKPNKPNNPTTMTKNKHQTQNKSTNKTPQHEMRFWQHAKQIILFPGNLCYSILLKGTFVWKSVPLQHYILHSNMIISENGSLEWLWVVWHSVRQTWGQQKQGNVEMMCCGVLERAPIHPDVRRTSASWFLVMISAIIHFPSS